MEFKFTENNLMRIEQETKKYPVKKPAVMAALYIAQEQNGFISNEVIKEVANVLEIPSEEVLGV
ncbi:MAG TPA: NAD(P)H-dependent oxidoreductase subunit E, partial [Ignavibacteriaceae bacterium]